MTTSVLDAIASAYPLITNRIQASIYLESSPGAVVASIIDSTAGHPQRNYHFPGLTRDNYKFSLDEINGSGVPINNLALFDVVPGTIDGTLTRDDEQIEVGVTTGFNVGDNTFIFDGTGGKPDYRNWVIVPSELDGRGILKLGLDYSWDKVTGTFLLLQSGDVFADMTYYNIHFNPIENPVGNSYPTVTDFQIFKMTVTGAIDLSWMANKLIIAPVADYLEATLPDISTVPEGRRIMIEVEKSGSQKGVRILANGSDPINFLLRNTIYMTNMESLSIYKYTISTGIYVWRVDSLDGNYKTVGNIVSSDADSSDIVNIIPMDGSRISNERFNRLYNDFVLQLPISQVVNYDDWATGDNNKFYSLANSANSANDNMFFVPNRKGLFERNIDTGKAGDYFTDSVKPLSINLTQGDSYTGTGGPSSVGRGSAHANVLSIPVIGTGSETAPKHYLTNKYILV